MSEFDCLGTVLCKHGEMEKGIKERELLKNRQAIVSLAWVLIERNAFIDVKRELQNSILLLTLTDQRSIHEEHNNGECVKWKWVTCMREVCGVTRCEGESNESVHERCGVGTCMYMWCKFWIGRFDENTLNMMWLFLEDKEYIWTKLMFLLGEECQLEDGGTGRSNIYFVVTILFADSSGKSKVSKRWECSGVPFHGYSFWE